MSPVDRFWGSTLASTVHHANQRMARYTSFDGSLLQGQCSDIHAVSSNYAGLR